MDDMALLREYATRNSEAAFAELVSRKISFVHSAALRQVRDPQLAEEITQAVFIILARKADRLPGETVLTGWLFRTTRFTALAQTRAIAQRRQREQEAHMQSEIESAAPDPLWEQLSPLLDEALAKLGEKDRQAVLLRYFENKSLTEVGTCLGTSENTAGKRIARALEKLHRIFLKRGIVSTTAILAGAISANSVQAAPAVLAKSVTTVAIAKGAAASGSTLILIKGALKVMAWTKAKTAVVAGTCALLAVGTATVVLERVMPTKPSSTDISWTDNPEYWALDGAVLSRLPSAFILRPTRFPKGGGMMNIGDRAIGINCSVKSLLAVAYGSSWQRMIITAELPQENFDCLMTPPHKPWQSLQTELQNRFGLTAHRESRETTVLQLRSKSEQRTSLNQSTGERSFSSSGPGELKVGNQPIYILIGRLEDIFGQIVTDHTELKGRYDFTLKWERISGQDNTTEQQRIRQALLDQLGLELVPSREPIEMLVVEKAK